MSTRLSSSLTPEEAKVLLDASRERYQKKEIARLVHNNECESILSRIIYPVRATRHSLHSHPPPPLINTQLSLPITNEEDSVFTQDDCSEEHHDDHIIEQVYPGENEHHSIITEETSEVEEEEEEEDPIEDVSWGDETIVINYKKLRSEKSGPIFVDFNVPPNTQRK